MRRKLYGIVLCLAGEAAVEAQDPVPVSPTGVPGIVMPVQYAPGPGSGPYQPIPGYMPGANMGGMRTASEPAMGGMPTGTPPMGSMPGMPMGAAPYGPPGAFGDGPPSDAPRGPFLWMRADFVLAWMTPGPQHTPLITSGSPLDLVPGAVGNPGTAILYGGNNIDFGTNIGIRVEGGVFLDRATQTSIDVSWLALRTATEKYTAASDANGNPLIARPFFDVTTGAPGALQISSPNTFAGSTSVSSSSDFWSLDFNLRKPSWSCGSIRSDVGLGLRTLSLDENIKIRDARVDTTGGNLAFNGAVLNAGDQLSDQDRFQVRNQFYGLQLGGGLNTEYQWLSASVFSKIGLGFNDQNTKITGSTTLTSPLIGNASTNGGVLAQVSNIGKRQSYAFGVVPELGGKVGINLHPNIRVTGGYSVLLWTNVLRPGDLIDANVNSGLIPSGNLFGTAGTAQPAYTSHQTTFVLQTVDVGLEIRY